MSSAHSGRVNRLMFFADGYMRAVGEAFACKIFCQPNIAAVHFLDISCLKPAKQKQFCFYRVVIS